MQLALEQLTIEQKLGLILTVRRVSDNNLDYIKYLIRQRSVACLQIKIAPGNVELINELRAEADYPLIIINDMEQGYAPSGLPLLPAMTLAACDNPEYYRAFARGIVANAKADGYNGMWGPVVDILRVGSGCTPNRFYGDTPEKVSLAVQEMASVFTEGGFVFTGKHYPGGKDRATDTHMAEAVSNVSEQELIEFDLKPYLDLMKRGMLPAIMSRHCTFSKIDPEYPATLSKKVIDIIRRLGFDGVIFTDSLAMMGILQKYGERNAMALAIEAGCDLILPNYRTDHEDCYKMMLHNWKEGKISAERLDDAVRHILALQKYVAENQEKTVDFKATDRQKLNAALADCITAVTDKGVVVSLPDTSKKRLFVILTERNAPEGAVTQEVSVSSWYSPERIAAKILAEFPNGEIAYISEFPTAKQNEILLNKATEFEEVVFVTFCTAAAYQGTDCLTRRTEALINALGQSGKISAIVHFGNPFAVENLCAVPRVIFAYGASASQPYAIEVLSGKRTAKGRLLYDVFTSKAKL